ncbi:MAG: hypothetical protein COU47_01540 [Candidatus Niyogibacteria bacterium CG10_big_fil_rev_8_21_14_0_10_46_36]|uniref:Uncharacterized protein n=1 Tax=Candidatus Niyogibacteria bacterium CG10_big_fil_rev_8_21_14_0_10_46_36 TaxID=1974726 RepID=A0A2H0TDX4_9BACT|nr:MAG: hypothetical protein COU47_01540 [Candidatus Niyogibacteria bacterium CG10_big_fil_rev_8_21_14_0_10_46_36]
MVVGSSPIGHPSIKTTPLLAGLFLYRELGKHHYFINVIHYWYMDTVEVVIFYILLIDSIGANLASWFGTGTKWYQKHFRVFSRSFPLSKGWTTYYFILVVWIGVMLYRAGILWN